MRLDALSCGCDRKVSKERRAAQIGAAKHSYFSQYALEGVQKESVHKQETEIRAAALQRSNESILPVIIFSNSLQ